MKKKVFITGSNGLLGQKLVHLLRVDKQVELIAASKGENRISVKEGYRYIDLDITNALQLEKSFSEALPDVVINTAAMTNVDACESQKEECWQLNVNAVQQMVTVLTTLKEKHSGYDPHFIHLSTDFVFNGEAGPYTEYDQPDPLSYYALSKFESEKIVQQSSLKWAIA
ncbi:MAG: SDR family oxidoreductase, partial [Flavobacteriales bacterium]